MDENRTQEPSKRRRLEARERGQAAHSPELTGAAGFLGASLALVIWGGDLGSALVTLIRRPLIEGPTITTDAAKLADRLRADLLDIAGPFSLVLCAFTISALIAHHAQVKGLFAPSLLAPDVSRLWVFGGSNGIGQKSVRSVWSLAKATLVVLLAAWVVQADWFNLQRLGSRSAASLGESAGDVIRHLSLVLGFGMLVLGLFDFWLRHTHFEAMLRLTPEEHREDLRAMEGDPALRARRRQIARSWRGDSPEILAGASLVLTGPSGLTVVLAGGPPPRKVTVRSIVTGLQGERLRQGASAARLLIVEAPALARQFANRRPPSIPLSSELLTELAPHWNSR